MVSVWNYVITCISLYLVWGICWYGLDRKWGVWVYRKWYNMTHKDPLPADVKKGFIYNQNTKQRVLWAWVFSTVQSIITLYEGDVSLLTEFLMWNVEVPVTLIAFMIAPYFYRFWQKRDRVFETIDKLEHGDIRVNVSVKERTQSFHGRAKANVERIIGVFRSITRFNPLRKGKTRKESVQVLNDKQITEDRKKIAEETKKEAKETLHEYIQKHSK